MLTTPRTQKNPYVGPRPFETGEALYGRDDELYRLVNLLIAKRIVLLYSPSGAGKTSLIQAGLVPRLRGEGFNVLPVVRVNLDLSSPDLLPTANRYLVSTVSSLDRPLPTSEQVGLSELAGMDLSTYLERRPRAAEGRSYDVLIFDQFEELLTLDPTDQAAKQAFMEQVGEALRDRQRWALFSMREEFIAGLEPYLRSIPTRLSTTFRLDLLGETAARAAMQTPAAESGVTFSEAAARKLVDELRRTRVQRSNGAREELGPYVEPVQLQVVCRQLWERLPADVTEITEAHVADFGDVNTALAGYYLERVRAVVERTGVGERAVRDWFDHITEQGFRTQVLHGPEGGGDHDGKVLDALQDAHLIRAEQRRGATWYELAHDRLITPVRDSNAQWREETLTPFQRAAATWNQYDRSDSFLLPDEALADAEPSLADQEQELTAVERDFLAACRRAREQRARAERQARRTRRLAVVASVVSVVALVALGLAVARGRDARHQGRLARARELVTLAESNASADPSLRGLLALEAVKQAGSGDEPVVMDARQSLYKAVYHSVPAPLFTLPTRAVVTMAATPDGRRLATAARGAGHRQIEIWDIETKDGRWASRTANPVVLPNKVDANAIAFSPDGKMVATAGDDGKGRLWDAASPKKKPVELAHFEQGVGDELTTEDAKPWVLAVAFSPDSKRVVTTGADGWARVWDMAGKNVDSVHNKFGQAITAAAFNPHDGNQLALANPTGLVAIWGLNQEKVVTEFVRHTGAVTALTFNSTGTRLASAADNGWVIVRDVALDESRPDLPHPQAVNALAFNPTGDRLATAGMDGRAVVWDLASGEPVVVFAQGDRPVRSVVFRGEDQLVVAADNAAPGVWEVPRARSAGHDLGLARLAVSPQGTRLVTAGADKTARVWDAATGKELFTLAHGGKVYDAAFSPDGGRIVTASADKTAKVWDAATGKELFALAHGDEVDIGAFSPDGSRVVTASDDRTAKVWDASTGHALYTLQHNDKVRSASFSPDGRSVVTGSWDHTAKLWDASNGQGLFPLSHEDEVLSTAWSPDSSRVATAANDGSVSVWNAASGERLAWPGDPVGHVKTVNAVAFSPDGTRLVTGSADNTAAVWEIATGKELRRLGHDGEVTDVAFSPDGKTVATAGADALGRLWDAESGEQTAWLHHGQRVNSIKFSAGGARVFTASGDGTARAWDVVSGAAGTAFAHPTYRHLVDVSDVEFSRDGKVLATASDDGTVRVWSASDGGAGFRRQRESSEAPGFLWDVAARTDPRTIYGHAGSVYEISLSPDGKQVATASEDHTAKVWDIASGTSLLTLAHGDVVDDVAFSPDGTTIATAGQDGTAVIWDRQGKRLHDLHHKEEIHSVTFSPDGTKVATASADKTVKVWSVRDGRLAAEPLVHDVNVFEVVFSERRNLMATASEASVKIWDVRDGSRFVRELKAKSGDSNEDVDVTNLAFSRDGELLAAGTVDGIVVWHVRSGRPLLRISQGGLVRAVSFSPDGRRLAVAGAGKEFYVYELDVQKVQHMAALAAGRSLSAAECKRYLSSSTC